MHFTLRIELGNDAMQTAGDIASALRSVSRGLDDVDTGDALASADAVRDGIRDHNGNSVGEWAVLDTATEAREDSTAFFGTPAAELDTARLINALGVVVFDAGNRAAIDPQALKQARRALGLEEAS